MKQTLTISGLVLETSHFLFEDTGIAALGAAIRPGKLRAPVKLQLGSEWTLISLVVPDDIFLERMYPFKKQGTCSNGSCSFAFQSNSFQAEQAATRMPNQAIRRSALFSRPKFSLEFKERHLYSHAF